MKNFLAPLCALIFLLPQPATSQSIVVRGGEHSDFTRLVMRIPTGSEWSISGEEGRYVISLDDHMDGFDTSNTFDVIPQSRLLAVNVFSDQLSLVLNCDCPIDAFLEQDEYLVLDIKNGPQLPESLSTETVNSPEPQLQRRIYSTPFSFGELLWSRRKNESEPSSTTEVDRTDTAQTTIAKSEKLSASESAVVDATLETLLLGVSEALTRGILERKETGYDQEPEITSDPERIEIFDSSAPEKSPRITRLGNIRVTNSKDIPDGSSLSALDLSEISCASSDLVSIAAWGEETDIYSQLSALRSDLFTETGNLNRNAAINLTRFYLFMGFGAEAHATLSLNSSLGTDYPELFDLAEIFERGFSTNPRFVHKYAHCDSAWALWAAIAAQNLPEDGDLNVSAALRELTSLPTHLKRVIAPQLSSRLIAIEETEAAAQAIRSVENIGPELIPEAVLTAALLSDSTTSETDPDQLLSLAIRNNREDSPEAVVELVNRTIALSEPIPSDLFNLLEAYLYEHKDSPISTLLEETLLIAASKKGNFDKAFGHLQKPKMMGQKHYQEIVESVFTDLIEIGSNEIFLQYVFLDDSRWLKVLSSGLIRSTAIRLLDLGFADKAKNILLNDPVLRETETAKLLLAKAEIELGSSTRAINLLNDLEGADAALLRGQAYSIQEDHESAHFWYSEAESTENATREGWLSSDWLNLTQPDDVVTGSLHSIVTNSVDFIPMNDEMLHSTEQALAKSVSSREVMGRLLATLPNIE